MNTVFFPRRLLMALAVFTAWLPCRADVFLVPDTTSDAVVRVTAAGAKSNVIGSDLNDPQQVATGPDGQLYVADGGTGKVLRFPPTGGSPTQVGDTIAGLTALAFAADGTLHIASSSDRTLRKLVGDSFQILATLPGGGTPQGIAFAPDGDLYVADSTGNTIHKITPAGVRTDYNNDVTAPFAIAFDAAGRPFATDAGEGGRIVRFQGNGNQARAEVKNLGTVRGLTFDQSGVAHYLRTDGGGELHKVAGNSTELIAGSLGNPRHVTARGAVRRVVAFKGQTLAVENNAALATLGSPAIGGGFTAFKGTLLPGVAGVATSNAAGMWRVDAADTAERLARKTFAPPGLPNDVFVSFGDPILNDGGRVAFLGTMKAGLGTTTAANSTAIFSDATGALGPVLRKGDPAPGPGFDPSVKFTAFRQLVLADDAGPAVLASIAGQGISARNNLGLWSADTNGDFSLVVLKGADVVFTDKTRQIASFDLFKASPLSLGHGRHVAGGREFVFGAKFTDGFSAILRASPGNAPAVLAEKNGSTGAAIAGGKFASFNSPSVSNMAGVLSFNSKLVPNVGGVTLASAGAIISQDAGTNHLVAQKTFATTDPAGAFYATLTDVVVSQGGATAFLGKMKAGIGGILSSTAAAIWLNSGAGTASNLAVQQGDATAGVNGAKFTRFKQFVLPNTGGPVFTASIAGNGITTANNFGIWACDGAGGVELLLRKGDKPTIDGVKRTVTAINIFKAAPGVSGQSRHFDADGNVACQVRCSDGTQAVLTFSQP